MNKAERALNEINAIDRLAAQSSPVHSLSPLSKLFLTILYIGIVVSFNKYNLTGIAVMVLFPIIGYAVSGIPVSQCFIKLRIVMPLVCAVGIINPFLDKAIIMYIGSVGIRAGVISMITLMLKGIFSLMMSFLLISTTKIEGICLGLRKIHFPKMLTALILLTYRYLSLLLKEAAIMSQSYQLRAPGQKGIHISAWGSFLGQLILRSMDRASALFDSMMLRGFEGEFYYASSKKYSKTSWAVALIAALLMLAARLFNVSVLIGNAIVR